MGKKRTDPVENAKIRRAKNKRRKQRDKAERLGFHVAVGVPWPLDVVKKHGTRAIL